MKSIYASTNDMIDMNVFLIIYFSVSESRILLIYKLYYNLSEKLDWKWIELQSFQWFCFSGKFVVYNLIIMKSL